MSVTSRARDFAAVTPRLIASVVLPVPPFWDKMAMIFMTCAPVATLGLETPISASHEV